MALNNKYLTAKEAQELAYSVKPPTALIDSELQEQEYQSVREASEHAPNNMDNIMEAIRKEFGRGGTRLSIPAINEHDRQELKKLGYWVILFPDGWDITT